MTPAPKRRWSFTLRTLFVVVTVLCCWLGYELNWIRQRQGFIEIEKQLIQARSIPVSFDGSNSSVLAPGLLWMLREHGYRGVFVIAEGGPAELTFRDCARLRVAKRLFPEAKIMAVHHELDPATPGTSNTTVSVPRLD